MPPNKILCVAEKPSIAKAVAGHLSGGSFQTANTGHTYTKNYTFDFDFGRPWGNCNVVMTCVSGHLTDADFDADHRNWGNYPPEALFDAPVYVKVDEVGYPFSIGQYSLLQFQRTKERLLQTSKPKPRVPKHYLSGPTVTERESILVEK